ncbi:MAG: hypothetical protein JOY99_06485 [Sphingomonadaceae bacterium]|nr:hypothetical protein [Sphingomonadaceae bacterium]
MSAPRFVAYETGGAREWMLARGPAENVARLLILQPLFEEMNRTRALLADLQRGLADAGIASFLVDLPGTGESERALETVRFIDWRRAAQDAAVAVGAIDGVVALRGGCLLDDAIAAPRWRLSPVAGAAVVRDLERETGETRVPLAGYAADAALIAALSGAVPLGAARTIRLNAGEADRLIGASPPWRRSEPVRDAALAAALVDDIAGWLGR